MNSNLQRLLRRFGALCVHLTAVAETRPCRAWLWVLLPVLVMVGSEAAFWPMNDYPLAMWHEIPRGLDIEIPQEKAAHMRWPELASYWVGGQIEGNGYYRPLTSWLFVAEYHLFGTNDAVWSNVNIALHLGVAAAILWFVALIRTGPLLARLATGALACLFFSGPGFADRSVHYWTIGWWPAQPESITLLCTFGMLGNVVQYARTGQRRYVGWLVGWLLVGVCFKEMTYVGGLGACLFLVRQRKQWRLLLGFASLMGVLLIVRHFILPSGEGLLVRPDHLRRFGELAISPVIAMIEGFIWSDGLALVGALLLTGLVVKLSRQVWNWASRSALAVALYSAIAVTLFGMETFELETPVIVRSLFFVALAYPLARNALFWPIGELALLYFGACWVVAGYPPNFGWYRLWPGVFASVLAAIAWSEWLMVGWRRWGPSATPVTPTPALS